MPGKDAVTPEAPEGRRFNYNSLSATETDVMSAAFGRRHRVSAYRAHLCYASVYPVTAKSVSCRIPADIDALSKQHWDAMNPSALE